MEFHLPERLENGSINPMDVSVSLRWEVSFAHPSDPNARLMATFEPFKGHLVRISRIPAEN